MATEWVVQYVNNIFSQPVSFKVAKLILKSDSTSLGAVRIFGRPKFILKKSGVIVNLEGLPAWVTDYKKERGLD